MFTMLPGVLGRDVATTELARAEEGAVQDDVDRRCARRWDSCPRRAPGSCPPRCSRARRAGRARPRRRRTPRPSPRACGCRRTRRWLRRRPPRTASSPACRCSSPRLHDRDLRAERGRTRWRSPCRGPCRRRSPARSGPSNVPAGRALAPSAGGSGRPMWVLLLLRWLRASVGQAPAGCALADLVGTRDDSRWSRVEAARRGVARDCRPASPSSARVHALAPKRQNPS